MNCCKKVWETEGTDTGSAGNMSHAYLVSASRSYLTVTTDVKTMFFIIYLNTNLPANFQDLTVLITGCTDCPATRRGVKILSETKLNENDLQISLLTLLCAHIYFTKIQFRLM